MPAKSSSPSMMASCCSCDSWNQGTSTGILIQHDPIYQSEQKLREVDLQQRFRGRELVNFTVLIQTIESLLAQLEQPRLERFGLRRCFFLLRLGGLPLAFLLLDRDRV